MSLKYIRKIKKKVLLQKKLKKNREWLFREENTLMNLFDTPQLTGDELKQIFSIWGPAGLTASLTNEFRIFKKISGFDPQFLPSSLYYPLIIKSLNPTSYSAFYENKAFFDLILKGLKRPRTIIKNVEGNSFNNEFLPISKHQVLQKILKEDKIFIKPISGSFGGRGVKSINIEEYSSNEIIKILDSYSKNYIIQEVIVQHEDTRIFNESSVNTLRVTSLFLNGKTTILFVLLMVGSPGNIADNSAGSLRVKISKDGSLDHKAFNKNLLKFEKSENGVPFKNKKITHYQKCINMVLDNHSRYFPMCGLLGWDLAINSKGEVVVIEVNTRVPGIRTGQICCGPLFGERTKEVIEYYKKHPPLL
ncbi:hypothetical protein LB465_16305 [Salegentibacter sp. LM13S]|uniref:sugar-transfer associated ATP-grasp domain-containing protein n=1 Tax=Salegentibacter lacus TaxID=2873599 RepID=UPI001CCF1D4A|nr:sugar-transfer associated ATP-grasp domain-containing protein [Salegentibacter lacus]MBZ9632345.1 hypothetical protein [Salegentibacter lacus]